MSKNKQKTINLIKFLINFAISQQHKNNPYITDYLKIALRLAKKINYRLDFDIHKKICIKCLSIRNNENTFIRTKRIKKNNKDYIYLKLHCLKCNTIKKVNITKLQNN